MNGLGDSTFQNDYKNKHGPFGDISSREDLEIKPLIPHQQRYKKNLLTNAAKISHVLEQQSMIDCLEADEEHIISAGRDHLINIWEEGLSEGLFVPIRRLTGHHAPVTGLWLFNSGHLVNEKIIVSSSEDGSIRIWSLNEGKEMNVIETGNVITCLGVMNKSLAVIGNHKGYMEVYHVRSGDLYTSIRAHKDPVDALKVDGNYVCTATFDEPSCLKIWDIQYEQTRCIYRIENSPEIEFCCLEIWNTKVILGASNKPKLFVVDFENDSTEPIILDKRCEKVSSIKVQNEWIISCFVHKTEVFINVHRFYNYEHFGTFLSCAQQVKVIAAIELDNSFKIIVGGSSLVLQSFDFKLTDEETCTPYSRFPVKSEKPDFMYKEKSNYTITYAKLDDFHDEDSSDSDDSFSEEHSDTLSNYDEKIDCTEQSNFDDIHFKQENDESTHFKQENDESTHFKQENDDSTHFKQENDESPLTIQRKIERESSIYSKSSVSTPESNLDVYHQANTQNENVESKSTLSPRQTQMLSVLTNGNIKNKSTQSPRQTQMLSVLTNGNIKNKSTQSPRQTQMLSVLTVVKREAHTYPDIRTISPTLDMREPRVAMRKLEDELDNKLELENFMKNNENAEEENNEVMIAKEVKIEGQTQKDDMVELIELDEDENHVEESETEAVEHSKINNYIKEEAEDSTTDKTFGKKEAQKENNGNQSDNDKSSKKKNKKCKKDKKKESHKSRHKKCEIM